jgi:hypothetical protein
MFKPVSTLLTPVVVIPEMVPEAANDQPEGGVVVENAPPGAPLKEVELTYKSAVVALCDVVVH